MLQINKIHNMDCLEGMKMIEDRTVDAIVTDPPFGIGKKYNGKKEHAKSPEEYWKWFKKYYYEMLRILKPGGFMAIWQTQKYFPYFWQWFGQDIHIYCAAKNFVQIRPTPINYAYDPVIMFYKKGAKPLRPKKPFRNVDFHVANTASVVSDKDRIERQHPYPRPLDTAIHIIENFTTHNGLVLDPFTGSGTIPVACVLTKRKFIGYEIEQKYWEISQKRLKRIVNQMSFLNVAKV